MAITLTALVQAFIAYRTARAEVDDIFDYHMQQMARSLRSGLPRQDALGHDDGEGHDEIDDFVIQENDLVVNVLNAPSPAATAALNVGRLIVEKLHGRLS